MNRTYPTPPDWLPALVSRLSVVCGATEATPEQRLWACQEAASLTAGFDAEFDSPLWIQEAERLAELSPLPPLVPSVYRDGVEVAPESVPPAVALLIQGEIAEGAGMGSLTVGGTVWAWD